MENVESVESRIETLTKDMKPEEVLELACGGCLATSLTDLFDKYTNLQMLDLSDAGLTSLKGFPNLPNLCELDLSGNQISGGLEHLEGCQKLFVLRLGGNQINDLDSIKPLQMLELLRELDLTDCEVTKVDSYREKVFGLIKSLIYLDGFDRENKPVEDSDYYNGENEVEDDEGSEDDEDDDDGEDEVGLSYLQKSDLGDDDSKDYEAPDDGDDDEDDISDEDDEIDDEEIKEVVSEESNHGAGTEERRGRKRKQDASEDEEKSNQ